MYYEETTNTRRIDNRNIRNNLTTYCCNKAYEDVVKIFVYGLTSPLNNL